MAGFQLIRPAPPYPITFIKAGCFRLLIAEEEQNRLNSQVLEAAVQRKIGRIDRLQSRAPFVGQMDDNNDMTAVSVRFHA